VQNDTDKPINYFKYQRRDVYPYIPSDVTCVLDVGCAEGAFGSLLKTERGATVWGVEINREAASIAAGKIDEVLIGDIVDVYNDLPKSHFDCIIFNDILEHLVDPWSILKSLSSCLTKNGYIVASIPNIRYYKVIDDLVFRKIFEYQPYGVLDETHLRFFTESTIKSLITSCGFSIEILRGLRWERMSIFYTIINRLTFRYIEDMRYQQYVCVAKRNDG